MSQSIVSAVFDDVSDAEAAVSSLRSQGVPDSAISIVAQQDGRVTTTQGGEETHHDGDGTGGLVKGALGGAGVGALIGIAALAIPGVGPFVAAGAIAASAIPGAAATGAAIGAAAGGLGGYLTSHGVSEDDARYYEERIGAGGVFVSVDTGAAGIAADTARDLLHRAGGDSASHARTNVM